MTRAPARRGRVRVVNRTLLAALDDAERLLVAETERDAMADLDEDAVLELHQRVRRARTKYVGQYRRQASAAVAEHAGRGTARPRNRQAALKAEAFEEALSRVSRRVGHVAQQAAAELRTQRIATARAARGPGPDTSSPEAAAGPRPGGRPDARATRSAASETRRADTRATGDRRQAARDARR